MWSCVLIYGFLRVKNRPWKQNLMIPTGARQLDINRYEVGRFTYKCPAAHVWFQRNGVVVDAKPLTASVIWTPRCKCAPHEFHHWRVFACCQYASIREYYQKFVHSQHISGLVSAVDGVHRVLDIWVWSRARPEFLSLNCWHRKWNTWPILKSLTMERQIMKCMSPTFFPLLCVICCVRVKVLSVRLHWHLDFEQL